MTLLVLLSFTVGAAGANALTPRTGRAHHATLERGAHFARPRACGAVDYRSQLGPARIMGNSAYCFAYSSATLITQRTGVDVSAIDLATGFYLGNPNTFAQRVPAAVGAALGPDFIASLPKETYRTGVDIDGKVPVWPHLEGGFEASTMAWVNARGLCPDRRLPAEGGADAYHAVTNRMLSDAKHARTPVGPEVEGIAPRFRGEVADRFHTAWLRFTKRRCRATPSSVPILPVDFALAGTSREFRNQWSAGRLDDRDQTNVLATLDYALDHERIAAIGFDLNTVQAKAAYVDEDGDHSVAVVARRAVGDECQYLIRDSAGYDCADFLPSVRPRCEGRQYWLSEAELRRSLYSVTFLR